MRKQKGFTLFELLVAVVFLLGVGGWIANIYKIVSTMDLAITGVFILRCIGVFFPPLGAVLGYF